VIFINLKDYSFLVLAFLQIDAQSLSNLFQLKLETLKLFYNKDQGIRHQENKAGRFYPNHHYNVLNNLFPTLNFSPDLKHHIISSIYINTI
jgi:hypothetical protein